MVYSPIYDQNASMVLEAFAAGCGGIIRYWPAPGFFEPSDYAVIFGIPKKAIPISMAKIQVLRGMPKERVIVIESAPLLRGHYWTVGLGGLAGRAEFRNAHMPSERAKELDFHSMIRDWKVKRHGYVIVCGQKPNDASVQDTDHIAWCHSAMEFYGDQALFRPHPKVSYPSIYGIDQKKWAKGSLEKLLAEAACFVTFNSTVAVETVLKGVPTIAADRGSFAWPVTQHTFTNLWCDAEPPRRQWLNDLAYTMWSLEEMRAGLAWQHLMR